MSTREARQSHRRVRPRRRNQWLGIGLAAVSMLVFVTAVGVAVALHESEAHHVVARAP